MKVNYMCCARSSSIDQTTKQLSLFHVLDEISAASFPVQLTDFCVACLFERDAKDEPVQNYVMAISLDDVLIASFMIRIDFANAKRHRNLNNVQGLTIPAAGSIKVAVLQKTTTLAEWHLSAIQTRTAVAAVAAPQQVNKNEIQPATAKVGPTIN